MPRSSSPESFGSPKRRQRLSPREFLRARRPERFSDSVTEESSSLDRSILEYHLETLTNRSQESDFERFARALIQREICPNLSPQTGPTGGGDSKVDAETYPVADSLSLVWYEGIGREASSERWAFAFSAAKDWRRKIRSDVAKLAETRRGYSKAFFATSQYVRDKTRAQVEDELRKKHDLDVRILDRSWILDRVFVGNHEELAIETLGIDTPMRRQVRRGPLDVQRERDLEEIEERITASSQEGCIGFQFVDDCMEAAVLARGLDLPRTKVEGRFLRAQRVAEQYGTVHQRLVIAYQWAWTAFWWYEDSKLFGELYGAVEGYAAGSQNAYELELLTNLWLILYTLVKKGELSDAQVDLERRTRSLANELQRLSELSNRPSTALQARSLRLLMQVVLSAPEHMDSVLRELKDVVRQSKGLVGFPLKPLVEILIELGGVFGDRPGYEEVFDTVLEVASAREQETVAARILLKRGAQQLDEDRPYEAIRFLGRALGRLYKHESRHDLVHALYVCAAAYERIGLLWAARGTLLTAASIASDDFWTYEDVTSLQLLCYNRLKWLELQLGRLPHILAWHEVDCAVKNVLVNRGYNAEHLLDTDEDFDLILGILLLKTDIWELKWLTTLPDVLDEMGLHWSALALRFTLGYEECFPGDLVQAANGNCYDFFKRWRDQPAARDLPAGPVLYQQPSVTLSSNLLGCQITVGSDNTSPCVELAESVLAGLESLLATGFAERLVAREPVLRLKVRKSDFADVPFGFEVSNPDGRPYVEIRCREFDPHGMAGDAQLQLKDKLFELLASILARVVLLEKPEEVIPRLFEKELAVERAMNFTSSFVVLGNVLGHAAKTKTLNWSRSDAHDYPLKRTEAWDARDKRAESESDQDVEPVKRTFGKGDPPAELLEPGRIKHTQMETVSLIREVLWNQAKWSGTAFLWATDETMAPVLALVFRNAEAAERIFAEWRKELGSDDTKERLRVVVIRGIDKKKPHAYRVVIGTNPALWFSRRDVKYSFMISRMNTMEPSSSHNLDSFIRRYKEVGSYLLAPLPHGSSDMRRVFKNAITKRDLQVREAWKIGRNDPDCVGINEDDDPIIPQGEKNAPVLGLIRWKRERSR